MAVGGLAGVESPMSAPVLDYATPARDPSPWRRRLARGAILALYVAAGAGLGAGAGVLFAPPTFYAGSDFVQVSRATPTALLQIRSGVPRYAQRDFVAAALSAAPALPGAAYPPAEDVITRLQVRQIRSTPIVAFTYQDTRLDRADAVTRAIARAVVADLQRGGHQAALLTYSNPAARPPYVRSQRGTYATWGAVIGGSVVVVLWGWVVLKKHRAGMTDEGGRMKEENGG